MFTIARSVARPPYCESRWCPEKLRRVECNFHTKFNANTPVPPKLRLSTRRSHPIEMEKDRIDGVPRDDNMDALRMLSYKSAHTVLLYCKTNYVTPWRCLWSDRYWRLMEYAVKMRMGAVWLGKWKFPETLSHVPQHPHPEEWESAKQTL